jgi:hypothetical protein
VALEQTVPVARRLRRGDGELDPPVPGLVLARVANLTLDGLEWRDAWVWPPAGASSGAPPFEIDAQRLAALRRLPREAAGAPWEADHLLLPIAVQDSLAVRPRYPYRLVVADAGDGTVIAEDEADFDARHAALRELVVRAVEARGCRPAELRVRRPGVVAALAPLAASLDVALTRVDALEAVPAVARRGVAVASGSV